jgi:hypothetical protein
MTKLQKVELQRQIKQCIIDAKGIPDTTPDDLLPTDDLKVDYLYDVGDYASLCVGLQDLLQKNGSAKKIKCKDVADAETVEDVIEVYSKVLGA